MVFTRPRIASRLRLLGLIGVYGGIFFLIVNALSEIVYGDPALSPRDVLLSCAPYLASIGVGFLLLVVSHKVDPSTGANRENLWRVFRAIVSLILFLAGLVAIAGALVVATVDALAHSAQFTPTTRQCLIVFVSGVVSLWLSRLASGKAGPVQRYPLDESTPKRRVKLRMP